MLDLIQVPRETWDAITAALSRWHQHARSNPTLYIGGRGAEVPLVRDTRKALSLAEAVKT